MKRKLNIGIVGLGHIAQNFHLPSLKTIKDVNIWSCCDKNNNLVKKISKKYKVSRSFLNYKKFISDKKLDAVHICTPPYLHYRDIMTAIKFQKHFFVEKPFTIKNSEAKKIYNSLKGKKIIGMCAMHQRYREISERIKKKVENGDIGKIYLVKIQKSQFRNIPRHSKVFSKKEYSGGGVLIDLGSHYFDLVLWILNFPKINKVISKNFNILAKSNKLIKSPLPFKYFNNEELSTGSIFMKNNLIINYELSYLLNKKKNITKIEFFGDKGSISWPDGKIFYEDKKGNFKEKKINFNKNQKASKKEVEQFIENVKKKYTPQDVRQQNIVTKLIDRLYQSSKKENIIKYD